MFRLTVVVLLAILVFLWLMGAPVDPVIDPVIFLTITAFIYSVCAAIEGVINGQ